MDTGTATTDSFEEHIQKFGYALLPAVFTSDEALAMAGRIAAALEADAPAVLKSRGQTYGSRDLIALVPEVCDIPRRGVLSKLLLRILGPQAGLVRALFFDKPPDRKWSLPWHQDRTIAVKRNDLPSSQFQKPTLKAGIPHVEAPESLLETMLTLRLHLDPMTAENGPLSVIPGSHLGNESQAEPLEVHAAAGDVLAMRPLISHSSSSPMEGTTLHRRIVHLEFAPSAQLADGYEWHSFHAVDES